MYWDCGSCNRYFYTPEAREEHCDARGHQTPTHECHRCPEYFRTQRELVQHMDRYNHWGDECGICNNVFQSEDDVAEHEIHDHFWCDDCELQFRDHNAIMMHMNSQIHREYNEECHFCRKLFTTAAALSHHLESGSCRMAEPFTPRDVYNPVRSRDPPGSSSNNLVGWRDSASYQSPERTRNEREDEYECHICRRGFAQRQSLHQHLDSPVHRQAWYQCPNGRHCKRKFTTLGALMNHLESKVCGYTRSGTVQINIQDIVSPSRRIGFR
ncbi:hypothetical protein F4778DRAFT_768341 [Xylariomycetidae sp. FL2044]|nr:hypothetical protein F4778DRAFT_768341 [Xylariomycetidae sp. FL2044]